MRMTNTANVSYRATEWNAIDWKQANRIVRNLRQRIFKTAAKGDWKRVRSLQRLLLASYSNRVLSVRRVTQINRGKNTPGVDKVLVKTSEARGKLVDDLKAHQPHETLPVKRVYIPKGKTKMRPLGIPVMKTRAMQAVVKNALEPEWESQFESSSYGFRPGRGAHDAIERIYKVACGGKAWQVLDADIQSAFDEISHNKLEELLNHFPAKTFIQAWLKAGYWEVGKLHETLQGTPQGGVISPLLLNVALNGMEAALGIQYRVHKRKQRAEELECISPLRLVKYADDLVLMGKTQDEIRKAKILLEMFLEERGLKLSPTKTRVTNMDEGFDFLGFNIRRYVNPNTRSGYKLLIKPSNATEKKVVEKLRQAWAGSKGRSIPEVLKTLNPIIRGQANYYRIGVSSVIFAKWDKYLYIKQRRYVDRTHPNKSRQWKTSKYWGTLKKGSLDRWVFGDKKSVQYMLKYSWFPIQRHRLVQGYVSPDNPEDRDYWINRELRKGKVLHTKHKWLAGKQKNRCPGCNDWLTNGEGLEIDHIIPKACGGISTPDNQQLLHYYCHRQKTARDRKNILQCQAK